MAEDFDTQHARVLRAVHEASKKNRLDETIVVLGAVMSDLIHLHFRQYGSEKTRDLFEDIVQTMYVCATESENEILSKNTQK